VAVDRAKHRIVRVNHGRMVAARGARDGREELSVSLRQDRTTNGRQLLRAPTNKAPARAPSLRFLQIRKQGYRVSCKNSTGIPSGSSV
jgi:hypothetical protein